MQPWRITRCRHRLQHTKECTCSWMVDIYLWQSHVFANIYKCRCGTPLLALSSQFSVIVHLGSLLEIFQILMNLLRSSEHFACSSVSTAQESLQSVWAADWVLLELLFDTVRSFLCFPILTGHKGAWNPIHTISNHKKSYSSAPFWKPLQP